jgi:hypothetical protein
MRNLKYQFLDLNLMKNKMLEHVTYYTTWESVSKTMEQTRIYDDIILIVRVNLYYEKQ